MAAGSRGTAKDIGAYCRCGIIGSEADHGTDYSAAALRGLVKVTKDANQSRRLLSLAAVMEGMRREHAARIWGMDRQTLRDWLHRFNTARPDGLRDAWYGGPEPRLSLGEKVELARIVETGAADPALRTSQANPEMLRLAPAPP